MLFLCATLWPWVHFCGYLMLMKRIIFLKNCLHPPQCGNLHPDYLKVHNKQMGRFVFPGRVRDYYAQNPKNQGLCWKERIMHIQSWAGGGGGIWFQPWNGSWRHCCAVVNTSQQEIVVFAVAVLVRSPLGKTPVFPEILGNHKGLTDSWRGKN